MSNLDGWDIVFVADVGVFHGPDGFMKIDPIPLERTNGNTHLDAIIGGMKIVPGGTGKIIYIEFQFTKGIVTDGGEEIDLSGATVSAQLTLSLHKAPNHPKATLVANNLQTRNFSDRADAKVISVKHLKLKNGKPINPFEATDINTIIRNSLEHTATNFEHMFGELATVIGKSKIDPSTSVSLYIDGKNGEPGRIAILSLFTGSSGSGDLKVPDAAQVDGVELLSGLTLPAFAKHVLVAAMASQFNIGSDAFSVGDDGSISSSQKVKLKTIKKEHIDFTPEATSFTCTPDNGQLKIEVDGNCPLKAGFSMSFTAKMRISISIDSSSGDLTFSVVGKPKVSTDLNLKWYDYPLALAGLAVDVVILAIGAMLVEYVKSTVTDAMSGSISSQLMPNQIANLVQWNLPIETKQVTVELDGEKESRKATSHVAYRDINLLNILRIDAAFVSIQDVKKELLSEIEMGIAAASAAGAMANG